MAFNEVLFAAIIVFGVCGGVVIEALFKSLMPVIADAVRQRQARQRNREDADLQAEVRELRARLQALEAK